MQAAGPRDCASAVGPRSFLKAGPWELRASGAAAHLRPATRSALPGHGLFLTLLRTLQILDQDLGKKLLLLSTFKYPHEE